MVLWVASVAVGTPALVPVWVNAPDAAANEVMAPAVMIAHGTAMQATPATSVNWAAASHSGPPLRVVPTTVVLPSEIGESSVPPRDIPILACAPPGPGTATPRLPSAKVTETPERLRGISYRMVMSPTVASASLKAWGVTRVCSFHVMRRQMAR